MAVQLCPVCSCAIANKAYEREGTTYCCEPCATKETLCDCGCCEVVEEPGQ